MSLVLLTLSLLSWMEIRHGAQTLKIPARAAFKSIELLTIFSTWRDLKEKALE
jgi:hypothetical protein